MTKYFVALCLSILPALPINAQVTIEECVAKAQDNYPLIMKYELLEVTTDVDLSEINDSWLPRISVYGQATAQNLVPSFPAPLTGILDQMGQSVKGLGKLQYKAGVDVAQTVWDGGASRARREAARTRESVSRATLDVEMYAVRQRVESLFFAILLTREQITQMEVTASLLSKDLMQLRSMLKNGVAMQSDVDMVEAQILTLEQSIAKARKAGASYRKVLELFIGEDLDGADLLKPSADVPLPARSARPELESDRPELRLFGRRLEANAAAHRLSEVSLMPKVGLFAQAYYGYPGFDYFRSMMGRALSFNIMAGIKVSWNLDSFYSRTDNKHRTVLNALDIEADRNLFLFNTSLQVASQSEEIEGLREVMKDDTRIISLRENVRRAAESQLENGVIDATALLSKISDESIARLNANLHEIQLLKEIYNLKYTLNR